MTNCERLLRRQPELHRHFIARASDPLVSGDILLSELRAAGLPVKRSSVFEWRKPYRLGGRHRPGALAGKVASAALKADLPTLNRLGQAMDLGSAAGDELRRAVAARIMKLGRKKLRKIAVMAGVVVSTPSDNVNDA